MREIETKADIREFVDAFYARIREDALLGPIFDEVAEVDWTTHLPRMYRFWETILFHEAGYKGNPVLKHVNVARKTPLTETHFNRWIALFEKTIDERFIGQRATIARERAGVMSKIMLYKCKEVTEGLSVVSKN